MPIGLESVGSTTAVIPVFITGRPIMTKWGDYSTFDIPTIVLKGIQQLWEYQMHCDHPIL